MRCFPGCVSGWSSSYRIGQGLQTFAETGQRFLSLECEKGIGLPYPATHLSLVFGNARDKNYIESGACKGMVPIAFKVSKRRAEECANS
jgi:hypothetical protein